MIVASSSTGVANNVQRAAVVVEVDDEKVEDEEKERAGR